MTARLFTTFKGFVRSRSVCIPLQFYLCWPFMVSCLIASEHLRRLHTCTLCKVSVLEAIGNIMASAEVSRLEVDDDEFDSRIRGGVLISHLIFISSPLADLENNI